MSPRLTKYATENGSRSFDMRCLTWFIGPMRTENLGITKYFFIVKLYGDDWTHPNITSRLPKLYGMPVLGAVIS